MRCVTNNGTRQNSEKELNEMEINNIPSKEFKVMIIKMLSGLDMRVEKH